MAGKKKYRVMPTDGSGPMFVEGSRVEFDKDTGATIIYDGDELVARFLNASIVVDSKPA